MGTGHLRHLDLDHLFSGQALLHQLTQSLYSLFTCAAFGGSRYRLGGFSAIHMLVHAFNEHRPLHIGLLVP